MESQRHSVPESYHLKRGLGITINNQQVRPSGILHIGGHHGEELEYYERHDVRTVVWIEADPDAFATLKDKVGHRPGHLCIQALITDKDNEDRPFYRHRFGAGNKRGFCSTLPFREESVRNDKMLSRLQTFDVARIRSITLATLARLHGFDPCTFQYLSLNVQGAELMVLEGMNEYLEQIRWIFCDGEADSGVRYEGAPAISEVTAWLESRGFASVWPLQSHDDKGQFYCRQS
jgi:FkbM family methyltransferase